MNKLLIILTLLLPPDSTEDFTVVEPRIVNIYHLNGKKIWFKNRYKGLVLAKLEDGTTRIIKK